MSPKPYVVTLAFGTSLTADTIVYANSTDIAWILATKLYGATSVLSVNVRRTEFSIKSLFNPKPIE